MLFALLVVHGSLPESTHQKVAATIRSRHFIGHTPSIAARFFVFLVICFSAHFCYRDWHFDGDR
jgi:hypothetical protein